MKKIVITISAVAVMAVAAACAFCTVKANENPFLNANVEALARIEQPDVNNCITDPNYDCEALHPTDPAKDKYREGARW